MNLKGATIGLAICLVFYGMLFAEGQKQPAAESDQQISEFNLAGYADKGKKSWDLSGKSADIYTDVIKLNDITGNLYGDKENVKLTSDTGDFNKAEGKVHLEKNVLITTTSGAKLTTNSLDWDRKNQQVSTKEPVNIERDNMITTAIGAKGEPNLKKVTLEKDVQVNINPQKHADAAKKQESKIVITCDGPLQIDYDKNIATFNKNVKVDKDESQIYSDIMDVYFLKDQSAAPVAGKDKLASNPMGSKIDKIVARGDVKIVKGENVSYSDEAIYSALDRKITLNGRPKLIIYSKEDLNASLGN